MNIESIKALVLQLKQLGFEEMEYLLAKRIAFRPSSFSISKKMSRNKAELNFQLFFEKKGGQDEYSFIYYDALFRLESEVKDFSVNGIEINSLEISMREINWQDAFNLKPARTSPVQEKEQFEKEQQIEKVIIDLHRIEEVELGRSIAAGLKLKYWSGYPYQEICGSIQRVKEKSEIGQRFYFFEGQSGISVDEAFRFLYNKWQERQLSLKRKETINDADPSANNDSSSGTGLLQKRKLYNKKHHSKVAIK